MLFSLGFEGALAASLRDQADLVKVKLGQIAVVPSNSAVPRFLQFLFLRHVGLPVDHAAALKTRLMRAL